MFSQKLHKIEKKIGPGAGLWRPPLDAPMQIILLVIGFMSPPGRWQELWFSHQGAKD